MLRLNADSLERLAKVLLVILLVMALYGIFTYSESPKVETDEKIENKLTLEPMVMTEQERQIFNSLGGDSTVAYDISIENAEEIVLDYWIEHYHEGKKMRNIVENTLHPNQIDDVISFILEETLIYSSPGQRMGYQYKGIIFEGTDVAWVRHSLVPYQQNSLTLFDKVEKKIPIELNQDIIIATKIAAQTNYLEFRGIFDESDPNYKTMINDSRDAYIFKIKLRTLE
ncbi:hypothetical protein [Halalkalibacter okhensis]|uniref:Uncharacterized protein n=1 Tax=Halalkalibacter okhensis TaxID=333138 RepID=A0A0B0IFW6_9BACI|nr:hypothetical protein [Halalkalibacter okhensis]KHF38566.1 hypothetical protein LQ50_20695 [Halalkalibacter okhensis]